MQQNYVTFFLQYFFPSNAALHAVACKLLNKLNKLDYLKNISKIKIAEHSTKYQDHLKSSFLA